MPQLPKHSVDLILCDLPYGTTSCKWDSIIPFQKLWDEYKRILKPRGAIALHSSQPFTSALVMSQPKWFRHELIWAKSVATGFLDAKRKPLKAHESILIFAKGRTTYSPQMRPGKPYRCSSGYCGESITADKKIQNGGWISESKNGDRYPQSILTFKCDRGLHPTQKPLELARWLIRTYSNPGDTVLDNCMGSGTTGLAATLEGRAFIGIEQDAHYYSVAENRIRGPQ